MFVLKMFYKHLIVTGFHTHHLKMFLKYFIKSFENILSKMFVIPIFSECLLNVYLKTFANKDGGEQ